MTVPECHEPTGSVCFQNNNMQAIKALQRNQSSSLDDFVPLQVHTTANMPVDINGRLYHLGLKSGESNHIDVFQLVANRIITVGDPRRALAIAEVMDGYDPKFTFVDEEDEIDFVEGINEDELYLNALSKRYPHVKIYPSHRGFLTVTGPSMMDFFVREAREIVQGKMAVIRFGTCGSIYHGHEVGSIVVNADGAVLVQRSPNGFIKHSPNKENDKAATKSKHNSGFQFPGDANYNCYTISKPCYPDQGLTDLLIEKLKERNEGKPVFTSLNATCDSFYSSQGRPERQFYDDNASLIDQIKREYPQVATLDMETFQLFHLSNCIKDKRENGILCSAVKIVVANRQKNIFLVDEERKRALERLGGLACLETLINVDLNK
ncbi:purine and uridine phosphorylase [Rozella allomycis CSF55]|uniref:Purine and uridine phosphorylase n=1 Tax=Rozella allomycis (strain CSF55) TaxID=988480 RepID=A0A4P9YME6_ROZAC|nr:purine and uridine phosphorylase [Rozella allomycis CSF55]